MFQYVLFDLDGTLTDPRTGITSCVQYALADAGIEEPDLDKLEPFIGPPLTDSFREFRGGGLFLINEKETEETDGIYTLARPYRVQSSGRIQ